MYIIDIDLWEAFSMVHFHWRTVVPIILLVQLVPASPQVLMLRMISNQVSSHDCNVTAVPSNHISRRDVELDCNFFLTAIRLASLNQILDPWVYLLLREIFLRKFCIMANAVSNCSVEEQKENQTALNALNKPKQDSIHLQKPQCSWVNLWRGSLLCDFEAGTHWMDVKMDTRLSWMCHEKHGTPFISMSSTDGLPEMRQEWL